MIEQLSEAKVRQLKESAASRIKEGLSSDRMAIVNKTDKLCGKHRLRRYLSDLVDGDKHNVYEQ